MVTKADVSAFLPELVAVGGVAHVLLGDRHHALPHTASLAKRLGPGLCCSQIEAAALGQKGVTVDHPLPYRRDRIDPDFDIIPTPGHTKGAFSYRWHSQGRKFLFIGDTLVPVEGSWQFFVSKPNRAEMRRTVQLLAELDFDVILSNSFAATPVAWIEIDPDSRRTMFAKLLGDLAE